MSEPTKTVTPLQTNKPVDETDIQVYLPKSVQVLLDSTFPFSGFENPTEYQRDFLATAASMAAKYVCQSAINRWNGVIAKANRMNKYQGVTVEQLPKELCKRTEFRHLYERAQQAKNIIKNL